VDTVGHVNNAAYLDLMSQAVLDALAAAGWPLDRLVASGGVPLLGRADVEYRDGARYGDELEIATWFTPALRALDAHQRVSRAGAERSLVQATTRWHWAEPAAGARLDVPEAVLAALRPVRAA
jgi:YbgC/YbaW family acyl-CoA thioester hydrolase